MISTTAPKFKTISSAPNRMSVAPGVNTTAEKPAADSVTLSEPKDKASKAPVGKIAVAGAALTAGVALLGLASPAAAGGCGWNHSSYVQSDGWNNYQVQESFNTCNGQHVTSVNGQVVDNHYDNVQRPHHHHHGHHNHGHHDNDAEVGAAFLFGILGGILLSQ